jgi:hypothetical protein
MANGAVLVQSKDKGYLNYLVVYQKHAAIIAAGINQVEILKDKPSEEKVTVEIVKATDTDKSHVSALIYDTILGVPFVRDPVKVTKTRGRPRKYFAPIEGHQTIKVSDEESDNRQLLHDTTEKIIMDYKEYVEEGMSPRDALKTVSELYRIPYGQAFNICADEL